MYFTNKKIFVLLSICLLILCRFKLIAQCNGFTELCSRKYNEVAYLTTHNAFNSAENNFSMPNQTYGITRQLNDGVRALMLDVYDMGGVPTVYHGSHYLGYVPLLTNLSEIKQFLDNNPNEVVSIIFESYATADAIEEVFIQAGLTTYLYTHDIYNEWPTLQEMINNNKRLIVFSDRDDADQGQLWYHYVWDFAVETHYSIHYADSFNCDFNRGDAQNPLFIFNHFITNNFGFGLAAEAEIINTLPFFYNRVIECQLEHNKFPNFITVDFYEKGHCIDVLNALNQVTASISDKVPLQGDIKIYPNPGSSEMIIELSSDNKFPYNYMLYNSNGKLIAEAQGLLSPEIVLRLSEYAEGVYHLLCRDAKGKQITKKIIKH